VKRLIFIGLLIALEACQGLVPPERSPSPRQVRGHAYAQANCSSCHAISPGATSSPNPNAPPFASIVNRDGLSKETLNSWLRDAHNYPSEMTLRLDASMIDDLVTYMLTLADPKYRPVG
jgi:mono/diheme cytochrome c family protein